MGYFQIGGTMGSSFRNSGGHTMKLGILLAALLQLACFAGASGSARRLSGLLDDSAQRWGLRT
jgi:hypothetical protein